MKEIFIIYAYDFEDGNKLFYEGSYKFDSTPSKAKQYSNREDAEKAMMILIHGTNRVFMFGVEQLFI